MSIFKLCCLFPNSVQERSDMSCYSTNCSCSRCREGMPESEYVRRATRYKDSVLTATDTTTDTTVLSKQEKLKELMKEFPDRSVEDLLKVLEIEG